MHDTHVWNCQNKNFIFSKRKCNVRFTGMLTNMECLETCNWILGPSINPLRRQNKCKRKSREIGRKIVADKFLNFSFRFYSMCFNISFQFRICEISWFSSVSWLSWVNIFLYKDSVKGAYPQTIMMYY